MVYGLILPYKSSVSKMSVSDRHCKPSLVKFKLLTD